jgi:hypothetical protein
MLNTVRLTIALPFAFLASAVLSQGALTDSQMALIDALGLPQIIEIMREEGLEYGADIDADLMNSRGGPDFAEKVAALYDIDAIQSQVGADLFAALEPDMIGDITDFFVSDLGRTIVGLEVSARRALLDNAVDEAAKDAATIAQADQTARFVQLETFVVINDLIETNVVGALNANLAFMIGLQSGGMASSISENQILTDVWTQEAEIRRNTTEWVYTFLNLAYQPLSDDQLNAYITFSDSAAGQALNTAMFAAFDEMFTSISSEMGKASAMILAAQDI